MKMFRIFSLAALLFCTAAAAQTLIPVGLALSENQVTATANTNFDIGSMSDVFDGNTESLARTPSVNPLVITLEFPVSIPLHYFRLMSATDAAWEIELANTLQDLNTETGSYQLAVSRRAVGANVWDNSASENFQAKYVRLTIERTTGDNFVHLREWELYGPTRQITGLSLCPETYYLAPGFKKNFKLTGTTNYGIQVPITTGITWSSSDEHTATVNSAGKVTARHTGSTTISAVYQSMTATSSLTVGKAFVPVKADKKIVKVALLLEDPYVPGSTTVRWHQRFGWNDPVSLAQSVLEELNAASDNTVEFQIAMTTYGDINFTNFEGTPVDSSFFYHRYETSEGLSELLYWAGHLSDYKLQYDYERMLNHYNYCELKTNGLIDEVWVFSHPAGGMYESRLAGPGAFWYNSPPIPTSTCTKLLSIMGFNNSSGVDNAVHSFGHRMESTMSQLYKGWNASSDPAGTPWDLYTRLDKDLPSKSQVGDIHYAPNSANEYEYDASTSILNFSENWSRYPLMGNSSREITCGEWECSQIGYMRWWFGHLPRFKGVSDGVLNDWWYYLVKYEEAKLSAVSQAPCGNALPYVPVTASNIVPEVSVLEPINGASYAAPAAIQIKARTKDEDGFVTKVEFFQGTVKIGQSNTAPFVFDWTNVPAGVYTITAVARDNRGATTTSVPVTVQVVAPAADLIGPACALPNATIQFTLNPIHRTNAFYYSWWFNGYTQSITSAPEQPYAATIQTGQYFLPGQVCVGVNYSQAPWYTSFCKNISFCAAREGENQVQEMITGESIAYPNPFTEFLHVVLSDEMNVEVSDVYGKRVYSGVHVAGLNEIPLKHLSAGVYTLTLKNDSGQVSVQRVTKQ